MAQDMLTEEVIHDLEKQQYRVVGKHSTVKICGWTKTMIRGKGGCYKFKFYGIKSNRCLQMTTSMACANRCVFCWRGYKSPVGTDWKWNIDEPEYIIENAIKAQRSLLNGFNGSPTVNRELYEESKEVKHVALSLSGEAIIYPKINEIIEGFHRRKISTFLVTNAQFPEEIKNLSPITQLYISLDAPTKELLKKIDVPLFEDYWERLIKSLEYTAQKKGRTCIRITAIKDMNMCNSEEYARLINIAKPDFVEVKAYMHVGHSQKRLQRSNMPVHEEIREWTMELNKLLDDYEIADEHIPSRVVLLARKEFHKEDGWYTGIDFEKCFDGLKSTEYCRKLDSEHIDEKTAELEFWQKE